MNKKSINIFTLNYEYDSFLKEIFNIKNLNELMNYITNNINKTKDNNIILNRLMEYSWYVYIDEIIVNKDKFLKFYENIIIENKGDQKIRNKLELIYNENIKKYDTEKNNINYHKIILDSINIY
jgi:hypothetical protein